MATDIKTAYQFEPGDRLEADALPSLADDESHNLPATHKGQNERRGGIFEGLSRSTRSPFAFWTRGNITALRLPRVHFRRCGESDEPDSGRADVRKQSANAESILDGRQ